MFQSVAKTVEVTYCIRVARGCVSHSVMSDSFAILWTVAHQAPQSKGILQARILDWVAVPSSRGSS